MKKKLRKLMIIFLVLVLAVVGCKGNDKKEVIDPVGEVKDGDKVVDVEEKIDEDTGLVYESSMELKYAKSFSVDYYKDGYKKLTDPNGRKVLLIPEGKEIPEVKGDVHIVKQPINNIGVFSSVDVTMLTAINQLDKVSMVTTAMEDWYIDAVVKKMESGDIKFIGMANSPDYELIGANSPDLMFLSVSQTEAAQKNIEKFSELEFDWIGLGVHMENDPRGRLEWVKYVGAIINKENEAETFFEGELAKVSKIEDNIKTIKDEKPKIAYVRISDTGYSVKNQGDYSVKMLEIAGGEYLFKDLNPGKDGITKMSAEEFYAMAENIDILIYENMGAFVGNMSQLLEKGDHLKDIKAISEGKVWSTKRNYWQSADKVADMIAELYEIVMNPNGEMTETEHYILLK